jgi:hypothetical protein
VYRLFIIGLASYLQYQWSKSRLTAIIGKKVGEGGLKAD